MIHIRLGGKTLAGIGIFLIASIALVLGISYYTITKLVFPCDYVAYGASQSAVVKELRDELLKRPDIAQVYFKNEDDLKLAGFLIKRPHATANLVACHGFKGNKEWLYGLIDMFPNWNILLFDFRAHGQSDGNITSIGCHEYKDVIAAASFMRAATANNGTLPLILFGISMGGASIVKAAETDPNLCDALIVDSSYANLYRIILHNFALKSGLPFYPFFPVVKYMFEYFANCNLNSMNLAKSIKTIQKPMLFIHACNDSFTAPNHSIKLFRNATNPQNSIWIGPRCRHGLLSSYYPDLYKQKVKAFMQGAAPHITV
jgi:alpha-beta hydrolase superfamily lysophospholipase